MCVLNGVGGHNHIKKLKNSDDSMNDVSSTFSLHSMGKHVVGNIALNC